MADNRYSPLKGEVIRVIRLDDCGSVVTGTDNQWVSEGFISVQQSPQWENGAEFTVKAANGDLCVNEKDGDRLKRINLTITLCEVDPVVYELMGFDPVLRAGEAVGYLVGEEVSRAKFGFEVWGGVAGGACVGGQVPYEHLAFGWVENAKVGDSSTEYAPGQIQITAETHRAPNYGAGPWGLLPTPFGPKDHLARYVTNVAPPEPSPGYQDLVP